MNDNGISADDSALTIGRIVIPYSELNFTFCRASGPGGQFVNRTDSAAQLRFDVAHSMSLPDDVRERLVKLAAGRITADGLLLIEAQENRSQARNREAALAKLAELVARATMPPKPRKKTRPSLAVRERRKQVKKAHSQLKQSRRKQNDD